MPDFDLLCPNCQSPDVRVIGYAHAVPPRTVNHRTGQGGFVPHTEAGEDAFASLTCGACGQEGYNTPVPSSWTPPAGTQRIPR